ncbi:hypothetical protein [Streptomyces sp. DH12]|uniref:hypothetical protein n=1 Tax=Streptomyces sp. DH12 TaxID=2857010 RepID=UPI001E40728A|nr:hypothetical protein [Streptomyces sp. DH12]
MSNLGDEVHDTTSGATGTVFARGAGVLHLGDRSGHRWRALTVRCEPVVPPAARSTDRPPGTTPVVVAPDGIRRGDRVRPIEDGPAHRVRDMRVPGPGRHVLHLAGRARPWVVPVGGHRVYRPYAAIRERPART